MASIEEADAEIRAHLREDGFPEHLFTGYIVAFMGRRQYPGDMHHSDVPSRLESIWLHHLGDPVLEIEGWKRISLEEGRIGEEWEPL